MAEFIEIAVGEPLEVPCGALCFRLRRREVGADGGLSLELHGTRDGEETELLRFDLFRQDPHFHIPAGPPKPTGHLDPKADSLAFALGRIGTEFTTLLEEAGAAYHLASIEGVSMISIVEQLKIAANEAPAPTESRKIELTAEVRELLGC